MRRDWLTKAEWALAAAATALSVALHAAFRGSAGALWRDEVSSVDLALLPTWQNVWDHLSYDSFPALFSLILRLWAGAFGAEDEAWRALGMTAGLGTLAALWLWARTSGARLPLISLILWALSPLMVRAGDSIRPYGLGVAAFLLAYALFWRWTRHPTKSRLLAAGAACLIATQLLYQNMILILAFCLSWTLTHKRSRSAAAIASACALSLLPYWETLAAAKDMNAILRYPFELRRLWLPLMEALSAANAIFPLLWAALLGFGLRRAWLEREEKPELVWQVSTLLAACAGFFLFLSAAGFSIQPRYFYPLLALVAVSLDGLLSLSEERRRERILRLGAVLAVLALALPGTFDKARVRQTNMDRVAEALERTSRPGDLIVVNPWYFGVSFQRYYHGPAPWTTLPPIEPDIKLHRNDALKRLMAQPRPIRPVLERIADTLKAGSRVFIVGGVSLARQPPELLPPAPSGPWGWYSGPYIHAWGLEASYFLQSYAANIDMEGPRAKGLINPHEDVRLDVAWGWNAVPDPTIKAGAATPRGGG